jgi:HlyD family secretion protein
MKRKFLLAGAGSLALVAALAWAFWPEPVPVDLATVARGPMEVTVSADGVTKVRDVYEVTAPMAGTISRVPVEAGDAVEAGETVVATIHPLAPAFLDARARAQAEAAVAEASAGLELARARLTQALTDQTHADAEYVRARALADRGIIALRMLEDADAARKTTAAAVDAARSAVQMQEATLVRARAQLVDPAPADTGAAGSCCLPITAPASGTVLSVDNASARLVQAGETLLTIGDLSDLEIEVDLLSSDAISVGLGAPARIERWGGPQALPAQVRRIEPSAFTRVSALGIEEQRVRVRLDLEGPVAGRGGLGYNYGVFVRVVTWTGDGVLQVPIGALFRSGGAWAVFRAVEGRAVRTEVVIGHQTDLVAEVLDGLAEGDRVVAFPSSEIEDGTRIDAQPGDGTGR